MAEFSCCLLPGSYFLKPIAVIYFHISTAAAEQQICFVFTQILGTKGEKLCKFVTLFSSPL